MENLHPPLTAAEHFVVSLRLRHPSIDPRDISTAMGLHPEREWRAGDRRVTPDGKALDGYRKISYWVCTLPVESEETLSASLRRHLAGLHECKGFLDEFYSGGGSAEFFVGWFVEKNTGDILQWSLLRDLAALQISLSLDIYGGPEGTVEKTGGRQVYEPEPDRSS